MSSDHQPLFHTGILTQMSCHHSFCLFYFFGAQQMQTASVDQSGTALKDPTGRQRQRGDTSADAILTPRFRGQRLSHSPSRTDSSRPLALAHIHSRQQLGLIDGYLQSKEVTTLPTLIAAHHLCVCRVVCVYRSPARPDPSGTFQEFSSLRVTHNHFLPPLPHSMS